MHFISAKTILESQFESTQLKKYWLARTFSTCYQHHPNFKRSSVDDSREVIDYKIVSEYVSKVVYNYFFLQIEKNHFGCIRNYEKARSVSLGTKSCSGILQQLSICGIYMVTIFTAILFSRKLCVYKVNKFCDRAKSLKPRNNIKILWL